jgi:uncharacterized protein (TIGR02996 family)
VDALQAHLRAILDNPADDTARLSYADHLEETAKPANVARAEFIRLQVARHNYAGDTSIEQQLRVAASLRREEQLLKKWVGHWLPRCLRPGYPGLRVARETVAVDHIGGYVTFERGFVTRMGTELPWREDESATEVRKFSKVVRDVFASQPLAVVSFSFANLTVPPYHAEIIRGPQAHESATPYWRIGWDMRTYETHSHDEIVPPLTCRMRWLLGRRMPEWIGRALTVPCASAARVYRQENNWPAAVEIEEYEDEMRGEILRGLGIPPDLVNPPLTAADRERDQAARNDVDWHR